MTEENKGAVFTDALGDEWHLRITTPDLIEGCTQTGLTVEELQNMVKANAGKMIRMAWYALRTEAQARKITWREFWEKRVPPVKISDLMTCWGLAMAETFPTEEDAKEAGGVSEDGPLDSGAPEISSS